MLLQCTICKKNKRESSFSPDRRNKKRNGRQAACKKCKNKSAKLFRKIFPEIVKKQRQERILRNPQSHLLKKVGITLEQKLERFSEQGKVCAACGATEHGTPRSNWEHGWCADHDHETGKFRGVLCWRCNTTLGWCKDSIPRLLGLAEYLKKNA